MYDYDTIYWHTQFRLLFNFLDYFWSCQIFQLFTVCEGNWVLTILHYLYFLIASNSKWCLLSRRVFNNFCFYFVKLSTSSFIIETEICNKRLTTCLFVIIYCIEWTFNKSYQLSIVLNKRFGNKVIIKYRVFRMAINLWLLCQRLSLWKWKRSDNSRYYRGEYSVSGIAWCIAKCYAFYIKVIFYREIINYWYYVREW